MFDFTDASKINAVESPTHNELRVGDSSLPVILRTTSELVIYDASTGKPISLANILSTMDGILASGDLNDDALTFLYNNKYISLSENIEINDHDVWNKLHKKVLRVVKGQEQNDSNEPTIIISKDEYGIHTSLYRARIEELEQSCTTITDIAKSKILDVYKLEDELDSLYKEINRLEDIVERLKFKIQDKEQKEQNSDSFDMSLLTNKQKSDIIHGMQSSNDDLDWKKIANFAIEWSRKSPKDDYDNF
jgi:hypothetical protein